MSMHVEALAFKLWRDYITIMIQTSYFKYGGDNRRFLHRIQDKTVSFKDELSRLKEVTTILELALWKMKIIDHSLKENVTRLQKKINTDESSIRQQCREACGADVVIGCGCCKRKLAKRKLRQQRRGLLKNWKKIHIGMIGGGKVFLRGWYLTCWILIFVCHGIFSMALCCGYVLFQLILLLL